MFSATVSIPESAEAGSYSFILKVTDYNEQSHVSTLTYTVNVIQEYNITFNLQSTTTEVNPGDTATWSFLVTNNGNGVDTVTLSSLGVPDIWTSEFDASNFELA